MAGARGGSRGSGRGSAGGTIEIEIGVDSAPASKGFSRVAADATTTSKSIKDMMAALTRAGKDATATFEKYAKAIGTLPASMKSLAKSSEQVAEHMAKIKTAARDTAQLFEPFNKQIFNSKELLKQQNWQLRQAIKDITAFRKELTAVQPVAEGAGRGIRTVSREAEKSKLSLIAAEAALGLFTRALTVAEWAGLGIIRVYKALFQVLQTVLSTGLDYEKWEFQLRASFRGVTYAAQDAMRWLRKFAAVTPLETPDVIKTFVRLKSMGMTVNKEIMTILGDTAFAMGKTIEDVATGFISLETETIRRLGTLLERTGEYAYIASGRYFKRIRNDLNEIRAALLEAWKLNFAGAMDKAAQSAYGALKQIRSYVTEFFKFLGDSGLYQGFRTLAVSLAEQLGKAYDTGQLKDIAEKFAKPMMLWIDKLITLANALIPVFTAVMQIVLRLDSIIRASVDYMTRTVSTLFSAVSKYTGSPYERELMLRGKEKGERYNALRKMVQEPPNLGAPEILQEMQNLKLEAQHYPEVMKEVFEAVTDGFFMPGKKAAVMFKLQLAEIATAFSDIGKAAKNMLHDVAPETQQAMQAVAQLGDMLSEVLTKTQADVRQRLSDPQYRLAMAEGDFAQYVDSLQADTQMMVNAIAEADKMLADATAKRAAAAQTMSETELKALDHAIARLKEIREKALIYSKHDWRKELIAEWRIQYQDLEQLRQMPEFSDATDAAAKNKRFLDTYIAVWQEGINQILSTAKSGKEAINMLQDLQAKLAEVAAVPPEGTTVALAISVEPLQQHLKNVQSVLATYGDTVSDELMGAAELVRSLMASVSATMEETDKMVERVEAKTIDRQKRIAESLARMRELYAATYPGMERYLEEYIAKEMKLAEVQGNAALTAYKQEAALELISKRVGIVTGIVEQLRSDLAATNQEYDTLGQKISALSEAYAKQAAQLTANRADMYTYFQNMHLLVETALAKLDQTARDYYRELGTAYRELFIDSIVQATDKGADAIKNILEKLKNWAKSLLAEAGISYLLEKGLKMSPEKISAMGLGEYKKNPLYAILKELGLVKKTPDEAKLATEREALVALKMSLEAHIETLDTTIERTTQAQTQTLAAKLDQLIAEVATSSLAAPVEGQKAKEGGIVETAHDILGLWDRYQGISDMFSGAPTQETQMRAIAKALGYDKQYTMVSKATDALKKFSTQTTKTTQTMQGAATAADSLAGTITKATLPYAAQKLTRETIAASMAGASGGVTYGGAQGVTEFLNANTGSYGAYRAAEATAVKEAMTKAGSSSIMSTLSGVGALYSGYEGTKGLIDAYRSGNKTQGAMSGAMLGGAAQAGAAGVAAVAAGASLTAALTAAGAAFFGVGAIIGAVVGTAISMLGGGAADTAKRRARRSKEYMAAMNTEKLDDVKSLTELAMNADKITKKSTYAAMSKTYGMGIADEPGIDVLYEITDATKEYSAAVKEFGETASWTVVQFGNFKNQIEAMTAVSAAWNKTAGMAAAAWKQIYAKAMELQKKSLDTAFQTGAGTYATLMPKLEMIISDTDAQRLETYNKALEFLTTQNLPALGGELTMARKELRETADAFREAAQAEEKTKYATALLLSDLELTEAQLRAVKQGLIDVGAVNMAAALGLYDYQLKIVNTDLETQKSRWEAVSASLEGFRTQLASVRDQIAEFGETIDVPDDIRKLYTELMYAITAAEQLADAFAKLSEVPDQIQEITDALKAGDWATVTRNVEDMSYTFLKLGLTLLDIGKALKQLSWIAELGKVFTTLGKAGVILTAMLAIGQIAGNAILTGLQVAFKHLPHMPEFITAVDTWVDDLLGKFEQVMPELAKVLQKGWDKFIEAIKTDDVTTTLREGLGLGPISADSALSNAKAAIEKNLYLQAKNTYSSEDVAQFVQNLQTEVDTVAALKAQYAELSRTEWAKRKNAQELELIEVAIASVTTAFIAGVKDSFIQQIEDMAVAMETLNMGGAERQFYDLSKAYKEQLDYINGLADAYDKQYGAGAAERDFGIGGMVDNYTKQYMAKMDKAAYDIMDALYEGVITHGMSGFQQELRSAARGFEDTQAALKRYDADMAEVGKTTTAAADALKVYIASTKLLLYDLLSESRKTIAQAGMTDMQKQAFELGMKQEQLIADMNAGLDELLAKEAITTEERLRLSEEYTRQITDAIGIQMTELQKQIEKQKKDLVKTWKELNLLTTLGELDTQIYNLNKWYAEQAALAAQLGISLEELNASYAAQRKKIVDDFFDPIINDVRDKQKSLYYSDYNMISPVAKGIEMQQDINDLFRKLSEYAAAGDENKFKAEYSKFLSLTNEYLSLMQQTYASGTMSITAYDAVQTMLTQLQTLAEQMRDAAYGEAGDVVSKEELLLEAIADNTGMENLTAAFQAGIDYLIQENKLKTAIKEALPEPYTPPTTAEFVKELDGQREVIKAWITEALGTSSGENSVQSYLSALQTTVDAIHAALTTPEETTAASATTSGDDWYFGKFLTNFIDLFVRKAFPIFQDPPFVTAYKQAMYALASTEPNMPRANWQSTKQSAAGIYTAMTVTLPPVFAAIQVNTGNIALATAAVATNTAGLWAKLDAVQAEIRSVAAAVSNIRVNVTVKESKSTSKTTGVKP